jgi:hypothetical protein
MAKPYSQDLRDRVVRAVLRHALAEHEDKVRALVAAQPDLTITAPWKKLTGSTSKSGGPPSDAFCCI